ncbi:MAG: ABC transporter substrate-binding protein [Actinomycetota bacterium]
MHVRRLLVVALITLAASSCGGGSEGVTPSGQISAADQPSEAAGSAESTGSAGSADNEDVDLDPPPTGTPEPTPTPVPTPTVDPQVDLDDLTLAEDVLDAPDEVELAEDAYPRTVEHALGVTEIPAAPKRIVALSGVADMDALLALGVVPYAAASYYPINYAGDRGFAPWNQEYTGRIETFVTAGDGLSFESLALLEPDLIVGHPASVRDAYDTYAGIAPTVIHPNPSDWREPLRIYGEALALEAEAAAAIEAIEAEIEVIAARVPDPAPSVALISPFIGDQVTIYNENLGAGPAQALAGTGIDIVGPEGPISKERLGELDAADWIIVFDFTVVSVERFLDSELFAQTPAAQAGRVVVLSPEQSFSWVLETSRSLPATLDGILTELGY